MGEAVLSVVAKKTARAIFLGAPGAGKGTQAQLLARDTGALHISTGDMLREHVSKGSELGEQARAYMDKGQLVPDEIIIAMVNKRLAELDARKPWILDGFPRTLDQARALDKSLDHAEGSTETGVSHVIYFEVPTESLIRRLSGRRTCSECGAIWHVEFNPTSRPETCDDCSGQLTQRSDDRPEAIATRLEAYRTQTKPLLEYYRTRDLLIEVAADRAPELVYSDLVEALR
jgi:adenylate kinase